MPQRRVSKKPTWKKKKAKQSLIAKVIFGSSDGKWWGDLDCKKPDQDPATHADQGWTIIKYEAAHEPDHVNIDQRVEMVKEDSAGNEPSMRSTTVSAEINDSVRQTVSE